MTHFLNAHILFGTCTKRYEIWTLPSMLWLIAWLIKFVHVFEWQISLNAHVLFGTCIKKYVIWTLPSMSWLIAWLIKFVYVFEWQISLNAHALFGICTKRYVIWTLHWYHMISCWLISYSLPVKPLSALSQLSIPLIFRSCVHKFET